MYPHTHITTFAITNLPTLSLAMAEMTTLVTAIYRKYSTGLKIGFEEAAPGVTSRFEVFSDDTYDKVAVSLHRVSSTARF